MDARGQFSSSGVLLQCLEHFFISAENKSIYAVRRKDFFEVNDGSCRLMAPFCAQLSQTARTWGNAVAPWRN